jgi:hypothetical protein
MNNPPPASYASPHTSQQDSQPTLLRVGGGLGIAGCSIGFLVLLASCFGFGFALVFSFLPMVMGIVGFVCSVIGGVLGKHAEGSSVAAALFINVASIAGGAMEWWAWSNWPKN